MMSYDYPNPVSRTYQYRKITKPLLERKRRARINRCLEELKDLMIDALETEGENISKLEKADILELTVRHLQRLQASRPSGLSVSASPNEEESAESRWQCGFGHCAAEACRFLATLPGEAANRLSRHLATGLQSPRPKNEQNVSRAALVSPTLKNLERTANIIAPCQSSNPSIETDSSVIVEKRMSPNGPTHQHLSKSEAVNGRLETIKSPYSRPQTMIDSDDRRPSIIRRNSDVITKNDDLNSDNRCLKNSKTKIDTSESIIDEEEEIDVVRIDDSCDPMWRPW